MNPEKFEVTDSTTPKSLVEKLADKLGLTNSEKDFMLATTDFWLSDETEEPVKTNVLREDIGRKTAEELDKIFDERLKVPLRALDALTTSSVKKGKRPDAESPGFYETDVLEAKKELENVFNEKVLHDLRQRLVDARIENHVF